MSQALRVDRSWDGRSQHEPQVPEIHFGIVGTSLKIEVNAPFHDDPRPTEQQALELWNHEVVELFLLGADEHYLELNFGPWGHHIAYLLHGQRNIVDRSVPVSYTAERNGSTWTGCAELDARWIPAGLRGVNAYAIHGTATARRYFAAFPVPGPYPDFHRTECFGPLTYHDLMDVEP